nr:uncharacterized protein LOC124808386 [Hydra vulgaris]
MLCAETRLMFKLTILLWLDDGLSCDLFKNVSYTVISNRNIIGTTLQQPVLVLRSGEKQFLNIIFNLTCTTSANVSIRFICTSCFWVNISINNVQQSSALNLVKNENLILFSDAKIINLNISWIQTFNKNLYDDLRFVIQSFNEVLLNDSLVKLNIRFSCKNICAEFAPSDAVLFKNNSFSIKINWEHPAYENATYLVDFFMQLPNYLTVTNFDCTPDVLLSLNLNFTRIIYRFNLTASLESILFLRGVEKDLFLLSTSYYHMGI